MFRQPGPRFLAALFALIAVATALFPLGSPVSSSSATAPLTDGRRSSTPSPTLPPAPTPRATSDQRLATDFRFVHRPPTSRDLDLQATLPPLTTGDQRLATGYHSVRPGESLPAIARRYLPQTSYMATAELVAALREVNAIRGDFPHPGQQLTIPGLLAEPIVERPVARPRDFEVRAIYLTGTMAGSARGLQLIERWRQAGGNAIVFDIKDSDGSLSIPFHHPLAPGNPPAIRNLPKFVRYLHQRGFHVIARIAIFRDELLVRRHPGLAVTSRRSGEAWRENGKLAWTDPSRLEVQDYNLALAEFAARSGADEIQFDYVRFPTEGDQKDALFAFQSSPGGTRADVLTAFVARAHQQLQPLGVLFSLDVFGVVAWQRPVDLAHTGQDIPRLARHCDVLSPMIYPSHFFGMDGYDQPGDAPEHFISASMERFHTVTTGSGVVLRPWLQAFGWRTRTYSPAYIETQVAIARQKGGVGFLFWNAGNDYSKPLLAMVSMRAQPARFFRVATPTPPPAPPAQGGQ